MTTENIVAPESQDEASSDDVSRRELLKVAGIAATLAVGLKTANAATPPTIKPARDPKADHLLTPQNCALALVDYQPDMLFAVASMERQLMINNVTGLAKAAKAFNVPVVLSTIGAQSSLNGNTIPQLADALKGMKPIDRTTMNAWEDDAFVAAIKATGRNKLVMSALWTEVCLCYPVLDMLQSHYDVFIVTDACGGMSHEAHERAIQRMTQAGAKPVTWVQVMLEWQRDWARTGTHDAVFQIGKAYAGVWGESLTYEDTMRSLGARAPAERR